MTNIEFWNGARMNEFWGYVRMTLELASPGVLIVTATAGVGLVLVIIVTTWRKAQKDQDEDEVEVRHY